MTDKILEITQLTISDDNGNSLVKSLDFVVKKGRVLGIVGESGSGKSLTMKSLIGAVPDSLHVSYESLLYNGQAFSYSKALPIAMIFQDAMSSLNPLRTIGFHLSEVIQRFQKVDKKEANKRAITMLEMVELPHPTVMMKQYPFELSGGMRQRVMIAMALATTSDVLIADEPTTALDVTIQLQILTLLNKLKEKMGLTIILVSHDLSVIAGLCDDVIVMTDGNIVERGTTDDIFNHPQHDYTKKLLSFASLTCVTEAHAETKMREETTDE